MPALSPQSLTQSLSQYMPSRPYGGWVQFKGRQPGLSEKSDCGGQKGQHMVKESDTSLDSYHPVIQIDSQFNIGLLCLLDFSWSHGNLLFFVCAQWLFSMSLQAFCIGQTGDISCHPASSTAVLGVLMRLMKSDTQS